MVTGNSHKDGERNPKGGTRSWGPAASGPSVSTSGSVGSPSSRSEAGVATPVRDITVLRLGNLEIHGDDVASQGDVVSKKKKRGQRATGTDKSGRGLRQFSMKVCEKVESKGRTTYNEVADELVAEYADASNAAGANEPPGYDEKNIRRRVYDALNVLMAMDIISKDKKEIQWKGLPHTSLNDIEELKTERGRLRNKIEKKAAYLQELEEQFVGYQNLVGRNQQLYGNGNTPTGGVALPFILVQTREKATVEVEISEDMQLVHFDFNSTPFELNDDNYVLKEMKFCDNPPFNGGTSMPSNTPGLGQPESKFFPAGEGPSIPSSYYSEIAHPSSHPKPIDNQSSQPLSPPRSHQPETNTSPSPSNAYQSQIPLLPSQPNSSKETPASPPIPGILKARV